VGRSPLVPADDASVRAMTRAMSHRGPDDEAHYASEQVRFGFRRLSIIDVTGGAQPLYNEDRTLALVFNGEVYNYRELQAELEGWGHRLGSRSDAEVVLHLYEERGADALHALRGMFAFALHDTVHHRLLLVRDRLGEKPLYVVEKPGWLAFASELRALLSAGVVPLDLDRGAVHRYLHFLFTPEPGCVVRGVRHLDAGCLLDVDLRNWRVEERRWWHLLDAPPVDDDPVRRVRAELEALAPLVIRSDVPVGVALSGGLDSSVVTALAVRAHGPGLRAFTVGYRGRPPSDERGDASVLARALGIPLHEAELDTAAMVDGFPATVRERDEPIADIAGFGHRAVMRLAHEHAVPVLLTGYGGDELFWGYDWVREAVRATERRVAAARRGYPLSAYLRFHGPGALRPHALFAWAAGLGGVRDSLVARQRDRSAPPGRPVFYELSDEYDAAASRAHRLYGPAQLDAVAGHSPADIFGTVTGAPMLAIMERICATYLRSVGLAQGDRLAMAHSVEARVPLVDYRLVELVVGLHKAHPALSDEPKGWLRRAARGLVPDEVLRRPKRGFSPPVFEWHAALMRQYGAWLRDGELVARGIFSPEGAATLASQLIPGRGFATLPFAALVLEVWCREMRAVAR
jgi:asparagine synthase (glutamine-hydrolysing)